MKKTTHELQNKTVVELEKERTALIGEITKLRMEFRSNPPKDTNIVTKKRKKLAAVLTMMAEKKELSELKKVKKI